MPLKDHYRILGLTATASIADIKHAFRKLAHQYHPDKNNMDEANAKVFLQIQEAYFILRDPVRKKNYDEQRYFSGLHAHKEPILTTPNWLLQQAEKLRLHLNDIDGDVLNQILLKQYILHLLSDTHLAILAKEGNDVLNEQLFMSLIASAEKMNYNAIVEIEPKLSVLTQTSSSLQKLNTFINAKRKADFLSRCIPILVILITCILCVLMYFYVH